MDLTEVDKFLDRRTFKNVNDKINLLLKEKGSDKLVIAFCGIFSSGKSSLLNEILKQDFKLPTGGEPVTKFVTRIEYGEVFKAFYISHSSPVYLKPSEVNKLVCGKGTLPKDCKEIVLQMPSEFLKYNVVLMDTPGYEDSKLLDDLTRPIVQTADIAVFCCNADHFGRQFEQTYFQELEDSVGNFLVVVNHSDVIHTDEEFNSLVEYVDHMIADRGKRKLSFLVDKTTFFTVGAGRYIDLDGLDQCLLKICTSTDNEIDSLKEFATTKRIGFQLKFIQSTVKHNIEQGHDIYSKTEQDLIQRIQQMQVEYESKCREVDRCINSLRSCIRDLLNRKTDKVCSSIEQLEKDNKHQDFVNLSAKILKDEFISLPGDIKQWKEKEPILKGGDLDIFSSNLMNLLNSYKVPQPVDKNVKNRGVIGAFLVSAIVTTVTFSPYWDDGYDIEYHGYALAAKISIRETFLPKFNEIVNKYLEGLRETSVPEIANVDASILDRIANQLHEWEKCEKTVEQHLERIDHILNKKKKILITGGFSCGKATLLNALIRDDIMYTGALPYLDIPTIVESAEPEEEDRIVYEYPILNYKGEREKVTVMPGHDNVYKKLYMELQDASASVKDMNKSKFPVLRTIYSSKIDRLYRYGILTSYFNAFENDIVRELLLNADALIFMISAMAPLDKNDREYIDSAMHLIGKQMENVFFVVNKINLLNSDADIEKLKEYVRDELKSVFTDKKGVFNKKLFDSRVFYVDAYGAMNTRLGRKNPITRNYSATIPEEQTGVPDLESALYRFLG